MNLKQKFLVLLLLINPLFLIHLFAITYQAEDGILNGTYINNTVPGYQGSGYVDGFNNEGDNFELTINIPSSGIYLITMGYRSQFGLKYNDLYINNNFYSSVTFTISSSFSTAYAGSFFLNSGNNVFRLLYDWGYVQIDWIGIEPAQIFVSNHDLLPPAVSTGQKDVYASIFTFSNPSTGIAVIKGITFTVKDIISNTIAANTSIAGFGVKDENKYYFKSTSVTASQYIYCSFTTDIQVMPNSTKNIYLVVDIIDNTINHSTSLKLDVDNPLNIRVEDYASGNTLPVAASSGYQFPMGSSAAVIQNKATELSINHIDTMQNSISTGQNNVRAMQLVFSDIGDTMTASIKVSRINFEIQDSDGNTIQASKAIKTVKVTNADGSFIYGQAQAGASSKITVFLTAPLIVPATQDFTCSILLDVADALSVSNCAISIKVNNDLYAVDANSSEPVIITSTSSFPKDSSAAIIQERVSEINIDTFNSLLPMGVVKGQRFVEIFNFRIWDNLGQQSAEARFNGITITVKNSNNSLVPANGVIERYYITDNTGNTVGSAVAGVSSNTYIPVTPYSSFTSGVLKYFRIFADILTTAYLANFKTVVESSNGISITDGNSGYEANKIATPEMPWESGTANIYTAPATDINVWHNGNIAPTMAGLGQPDVKFMILYMYNPGHIGTADIMVKGITVTVVDEMNNIVAPSNILQNIYISNITGDKYYAQYNTISTTAASFYIPFTIPLYVEALNTRNVYVGGDISINAIQGIYKIRIRDGNDIDRKSVPYGYVTVTAVNADVFPFESNPVTITALAYNFKVGHKDLMPVSVAQGSSGVDALSLKFENYNAIPIAVTSIAIAVKECGGKNISANSVLKAIKLQDRENNLIITINSGSENKINITPINYIIPSGAEREIKVTVDIIETAEEPFYLELETGEDVKTLPLASVNPAEGDYFGNMKSGCVSIQEKSLINSFHSFPNPFVAGKESAHIEFYLETKSEITMRIYTMDGRPVKEILNKVIREQGLYYNDLWDGKNEVGQIVRSGIYMCVLEVKSLTDGKTIKLKNKIAVIR